MIIQQDMDLMKKLTILSDAAMKEIVIEGLLSIQAAVSIKKITVRDLAMRKLAASATVSQPMADVFPY
mgnify:CR=1 FL=1